MKQAVSARDHRIASVCSVHYILVYLDSLFWLQHAVMSLQRGVLLSQQPNEVDIVQLHLAHWDPHRSEVHRQRTTLSCQ